MPKYITTNIQNSFKMAAFGLNYTPCMEWNCIDGSTNDILWDLIPCLDKGSPQLAGVAVVLVADLVLQY